MTERINKGITIGKYVVSPKARWIRILPTLYPIVRKAKANQLHFSPLL